MKMGYPPNPVIDAGAARRKMQFWGVYSVLRETQNNLCPYYFICLYAMYIYICIHMYVCICICMYIYICMYVYVCIYICMYVQCIHTCMAPLPVTSTKSLHRKGLCIIPFSYDQL